MDKVVQLYEVMLTRHTTMVVGQTGAGKSIILQALARAQVGPTCEGPRPLNPTQPGAGRPRRRAGGCCPRCCSLDPHPKPKARV